MISRFFLCLLLAAALFACGDEPTEGGATTVEAPLNIGIRVEPNSLNPILTTQASARHVRELIFQSLNSIDGETYEEVPLLASLADVRNEPGGGVSYSYVIDESATWPNGLPVTAADVIFSLKAVMNPKVDAGPYRPYYYNISNVVTSPNNERRFKVMTRRPYILAQQSLGSLVVYPEYAYDPEHLLRNVRIEDLTNEKTIGALADKDENLIKFGASFQDVALATEPNKIIGSGPYRVTSWEPGQQMILERRENYWAKESNEPSLAAASKKIVFKFINDAVPMINALRDETIDVAIDLDTEQYKTIRHEPYLTERYDFVAVPGINFYGLMMNQQHPVFRDQATRRAMAHLVDVDAIIEQLFGEGLASRVNGPVLAGKSYHADDLPAIEFNPDEAASLLTEAGWADTNGDGTLDQVIDGATTELSFPLMVFPTPTSQGVGALVAEWAKQVGIDVEVVVQSPQALYGELNKGNYAMALMGMGRDPAPDDFTQVWASTSVPPNGSNRSGFSNPEADKLIKQISVTLSEEKRDPLYRRFQEIIYENQPMVFLLSTSTRLVVSKDFQYETKSITPGLTINAIKRK